MQDACLDLLELRFNLYESHIVIHSYILSLSLLEKDYIGLFGYFSK
jgi:hypothetical protein